MPSFSQHNLRPVVLGCCLHFSVTKFQDKFTSLRQVNSLSSWEKFQICCTDMYLIRFLPNFAVFWVFLWISRLCDHAKYQKPRLTMSCIIYKLATKNLHLATIFLQALLGLNFALPKMVESQLSDPAWDSYYSHSGWEGIDVNGNPQPWESICRERKPVYHYNP